MNRGQVTSAYQHIPLGLCQLCVYTDLAMIFIWKIGCPAMSKLYIPNGQDTLCIGKYCTKGGHLLVAYICSRQSIYTPGGDTQSSPLLSVALCRDLVFPNQSTTYVNHIAYRSAASEGGQHIIFLMDLLHTFTVYAGIWEADATIRESNPEYSGPHLLIWFNFNHNMDN